MTIDNWLTKATAELTRANVPSARLDAELMLCHMLGVDRAWLIAHGDDSLAMSALSQKGGERRGGLKEYGELLLQRRMNRQPMAYLFGRKEFYGREFIVDKNVLVPRPETESMIELAKKYDFTGTLLDVGTGSGAIGLTLGFELKNIDLTLSDYSLEALEVAKKNAKKLKVKPVEFVESDLLEHWMTSEIPEQFDAIVANLPYVDKSWERSPETKHEPALALFANDGGLELIKQLVGQAPQHISPKGYLLLEAEPTQHDAIIEHAKSDFTLLEAKDYAILLQKTGI
ncbi:MAG: peptide chain release factor N(5)-glutamine methyltransferase [Candidatus Saccharimonadales bacterium]